MSESAETTIATLTAMPPRESVDAFDAALRQAYWDRKDIAATRAIARAGITRATSLADDADDFAEADHFRGATKTMAYNLASFTWPGWDEQGVTLTDADVADGRDAARLNLRLAIRLAKPDRAMADAHWLVGAHALAAKDPAAARDAFAEARSFAVSAGEAGRVAMLDGYAALVDLLDDPAAIEPFESAVATLRTEHAQSAYAEQLMIARKVFAGTRSL